MSIHTSETHMCKQGLDLNKVSMGDCWMLRQWGQSSCRSKRFSISELFICSLMAVVWNVIQGVIRVTDCLRHVITVVRVWEVQYEGMADFGSWRVHFWYLWWTCYRSRGNSAAGSVIWYFCTAVTGGGRQQKVHWACGSQSPCWDHVWKTVTC